ncbi:PREDICTED: bifunctional heparan sulfate N-deacetylase/N-sulfotransferase-like isoform X2 [Priapulus caudatus]|uniref:[heparan sulfate]-glucosamine N-sulfotransferase n=1 Tax=Priapulus caudatus TaxID=37621 RepID=A0ABM1EVM1_PRICU|nr:PREDICTED: bifunctional heparan sulfate N-deacetylase/N-sulfotransferase-like isoform X2 [Priapulus caudatus]
MWGHTKPHLLASATLLEAHMQKNLNFAKAHNISTNTNYSVAPHHSGVYPVHEPLYEAWRKLLGIQVTSTEEYPHLRPVQARRGFIYKGIKVLPRQLCGLFTHTVFLDQYPGGKQVLINSIQGGELFQTILSTPVSIFMTHLSNYGNDRLALYTFESAVKFTQCWTNLQLKTETPQMMAERYFKMYPEEEDPVWQNPCNDKRHRDIWAPNKTCNRLPNFLVIGPQKTGTTALYTFLSMHPSIMSNSNSDSTFEEVQFFNGNNYYRGLDWYMNFFPKPAADAGPIYLFEKSATYFESEVVPARAHALLPNAKIITLLLSPSRRAYSWYQHQRAHGDAASLNYSFYDVARANVSSPRALRSLQHRCLNPGLYARHLGDT